VDPDAWVEVEANGTRWRFDATFLLSNWKCIYGAGCRGIHSTQDVTRADGCCVVGAQLSTADDFANVQKAVSRLDPSTWQHVALGRRKGWFKRSASGQVATRTINEGCIFLNRPGFAGGVGCAFHIAALAAGEDPLEWKPYVCWQLPIRREDVVDERGTVSILRRWTADDFGSPLHWWCTEAPEAFIGTKPVWRELESELRAIVGDEVFADLACALTATRS
jgi:hypothetical protein